MLRAPVIPRADEPSPAKTAIAPTSITETNMDTIHDAIPSS
ncbi:hypothetical protein CORAM0001_1522 [Corynebacterium amycolatum SK46]|nr:hypothetical protein CORAM0001_1522 [Corynebacterium amycolatum SK46]